MVNERDPRIFFAAERTFLAWIRTGLAMMGFGFVVARFGLFLREVTVARGEPVTDPGGSLYAGTALVVLGVIVNLHAAMAHARFRRRFEEGTPIPHHATFSMVLAGVLAVVGMAMAVYLLQRGGT